ncbi:Kunitz/Bovine pancreatic trypsin inhibitor domain protein, partial [Teladorsagia circumcincta]
KKCQLLYWGGCQSSSQNFFTSLDQCEDLCESPPRELAPPCSDAFDDKYKESCRGGEWVEKVYFDHGTGKCVHFWWDGCTSPSQNIFNDLKTCQSFCEQPDTEMDCHMPLDHGNGKNEDKCLPNAGFRFYFDRTRVCFLPAGDEGDCPGNANHTVQRWTYSAQQQCVQFTYSGCGGGANRWLFSRVQILTKDKVFMGCYENSEFKQITKIHRFATKMDCEETCGGKKPSANTGCEGNPNKFETFELCQKTCELSGLDPCLEPLDRGSWCEAMSNRCEKRYPRSVAIPPTPAAARGKGKKKPLPSGCTFFFSVWDQFILIIDLHYMYDGCSDSGKKPIELTTMLRHVVLDGVNQTYYKSDSEWADYGLCLGYRYNVTGRDTVLHVHFCADNASPDCISETYGGTNGEEFCNVQRPFLRGTHLYTWYFRLEIKDPPYTLSEPNSGRIQRANETIAAILLLKPNHCHDIC